MLSKKISRVVLEEQTGLPSLRPEHLLHSCCQHFHYHFALSSKVQRVWTPHILLEMLAMEFFEGSAGELPPHCRLLAVKSMMEEEELEPLHRSQTLQ